MTVTLEPLPFDEAIAFFRDKVVLPPDKYGELADSAKAKAFSVSGVARMDVLEDLYKAVDKALAEGKTFADFKSAVRDIMVKRGWDGLDPWRLDTIFRTNIQSAYQAGHWEQMKEVSGALPYWQYVAVMDMRTRPAHAAMHGKVFRSDDPFWNENYPPNGFNCRCTVRALTEGQVERMGVKINSDLPGIADKGFQTNPGVTMGRQLTEEEFKRFQSDPERWKPLIKKTFEDYGLPPAREIRDYKPTSTELWPRGQKAVERYNDELLGAVLRDAVNDPLIMDAAFISHLKLDGREQYLPLIAEIVASPNEIWLQAEKETMTGKVVLRKRYIAFIAVEGNRRVIMVADATKGQWTGYALVVPSNLNYIDNIRNGVLLNE